MACLATPATKSPATDKQGVLLLSRAMGGAKAFLHPSLLEVPWLWRLDPVRMKAKPHLDSDGLRNYQKLVRSQIELLRQIPSNRICLDCGDGWIPTNATKEEEHQYTQRIRWANVALGVFLCSDCAKLHQQLLPGPLSQVLCLEWDMHCWTNDDIIKCAEWGNYNSQRYWASGYFSSGSNWSQFWKTSSDGFWCPRMAKDEYILKKYIEQRWVASLETPAIPLGKIYRPQERQVIEFVCFGRLDCKRKADDAGVERGAFGQSKPLNLLRRPRDKKGHETHNNHSDDQTDDIQLSSEDIPNLSFKPAASPPAVGEFQASAVVGISTIKATASIMEVPRSSRSEYQRDLAIDDELPDSFKFDIITPRVSSSMSSSSALIDNISSSETLSTQSADPVDVVDIEDLMKTVCDVGTQTDWIILGDAGY